LPKKPNYNFEKRKKELDRKAKKEEKLRRRRENSERSGDELPPVEAGDETAGQTE
jgi:hypothetical protein